jgi:hypothetical protein
MVDVLGAVNLCREHASASSRTLPSRGAGRGAVREGRHDDLGSGLRPPLPAEALALARRRGLLRVSAHPTGTRHVGTLGKDRIGQ